MSYDVFISHSSQDKATADAVCHALEENGIKCWIAPRDVRPGFNYGAELIDAIYECKVMVLLFSENSNNSEFVQSEVERAFSKQKIIIPYRLSNEEISRNLELFLSGKHWIDAYSERERFESLIAATANVLGITLNAPVTQVAPTIAEPIAQPVAEPVAMQTVAEAPPAPVAPTPQPVAPAPQPVFSASQNGDSKNGNTWGNNGGAGLAAERDGWIYYTNGPSINKMRPDGSEDQEVIELGVHLIQVVDEWIYYRETYYYLYRVGIDGRNRQTVFGFATFHFCVSGEYIFFANSTDDGKLYRSNLDGSDLFKLGDQKVGYFIDVHDGTVFYGTHDDGWYSVPVNGGTPKALNIFGSSPCYADGWIYYLGKEFWSLNKVRPDGSDNQEINPPRKQGINISGDYIYYIDAASDNVYRVDFDGRNKELIYDGHIMNICITGDWIFMHEKRGGILHKMKLNGSEHVVMQRLQT